MSDKIIQQNEDLIKHDLKALVYISDKLTILHGQSDHLSRRFRSLISERYGR